MPEDDSRSAILAAAWEVTVETFGMAEKPLKPSERASTKMFEQLKTAELARRAGLSTGAFYNRWPTREVFLDDFLDYALSIDRYPGPALLFEVFASMKGAPLAEMLTELSIANAKAAEANPTHIIQKYLWTYCHDRADVAIRLQRLYQELRDRMVPFYQAMLDYTSRELRPPFDMESATTLLNAVHTGLIEQRGCGGESSPPIELFAWAGMTVLMATSRRIGEERDLFQMLVEEVGMEEPNV